MPPKKVDTETIGKKLQPIYEALDSDNNKQAIKLIGPAITKFGRRPLLLTLWALALARLEQRDEATALINEVIETRPADIPLINTIRIVLRALGTQSRLTEIWQQAALLNPGDEQIQFQLFSALTRDHAYHLAQPVAMKLYTGFRREKYLFFNAVNQLLIHKSEGPNRMLQLAEMMIKRAVAPHNTSGDGLPIEHVRLLAQLSMRQCDYVTCEALLSSPLASLYSSQNKREYNEDLSAVFAKLGWREKRVQLLRSMLLEFEADWVYFQQWLDEEFSMWRINHPTESMSPTHIIALYDFINELERQITDEHQRASTRNPFLGRVELAFRLATKQDHADFNNEVLPLSISAETAASLIDQLISYYKLYGNKLCFFPDAQQYLHALSHPAKEALLSALLPVAGDFPATQVWPESDSESCKSWSHRLSMQISYHQCRSFSGAFQSMNVEQLKQQAHLMYLSYLFTLLIARDTPVSSERGLGDPFLVLFQSIARLLYKLTGDIQYEFTSLLVAEHALEHFTQHNYDLQLAAMRLYCQTHFAAPRIAVEKFKALEIKQIQHESLNHIILHDCLRYHDVVDGQWNIDRVLGVHSAYNRDEGPLIDRAYEHQNWAKVFEISEMQERMKNSGMKRMAIAMNRTLALMRTTSFDLNVVKPIIASATDDIGSIPAEELVVNSDYDVIACYEPVGSDMYTMLHRPAASHLPADLFTKTPVKRLADGSFPLDQQYADSLQLHLCLSSLLSHLITSEAQPLRIQLGILRSIVEADQLFDFKSAAPGAANLPVDASVWWLMFMSAETGACCIETAAMSQPAHLTEACNDTSLMQDHILRWGSIQRQINVIAELVIAAERELSQTAQLEASVTLQAMVVEGVKNDSRATDIKLMRPISLFLTYACSILSIMIQCCVRDWPSRKQVKKKLKDAETDNKVNSLKVWSAVHEGHEALTQLVAVLKQCLQSLDQTLVSIASAPFPHSSGFLLTAECASMLEDAHMHRAAESGLSPNARQSFGELITTYRKVTEAMTKSYQATAGDLKSTINAHLATLSRAGK